MLSQGTNGDVSFTAASDCLARPISSRPHYSEASIMIQVRTYPVRPSTPPAISLELQSLRLPPKFSILSTTFSRSRCSPTGRLTCWKASELHENDMQSMWQKMSGEYELRLSHVYPCTNKELLDEEGGSQIASSRIQSKISRGQSRSSRTHCPR